MRMTTRLLASAAGLAALVLHVSSPALAQNAAALSGEVSSAKEGVMEGVVVSAKKDGSTITVSVVSDDKGHFSFPATRLDPGHYAISIRAAGYDLDAPKDATVAAGQQDKIDVKLKPARNLSAQLTNAEWLKSVPGTDEQKRLLLACNGCHSYERIVKSTHDAGEFVEVFKRMSGYYPGSTPLKPQRLVGNAVRNIVHGPDAQKAAEYLASINLSQQETWSYPLKTLPRLTGKSTRVIITEYDLPNKLIEPHDVVLDHEGNVWYSDFGQMFIGEMDPKTGQVTQYPIPVTKPGFSLGTLDLEIDKDDNPWVGLMYQSAIAKFDRKIRKIRGMVDAQGVGFRCRPARAPRRRRNTRRRQGVDQEFRRRPHLPVGPCFEQIRGSWLAEGSAHRQAHRHLRHPFGCREQSLSARFLGRQYRAAGC